MSLPIAGDWNQMVLNVPSNLNHSMNAILFLFQLTELFPFLPQFQLIHSYSYSFPLVCKSFVVIMSHDKGITMWYYAGTRQTQSTLMSIWDWAGTPEYGKVMSASIFSSSTSFPRIGVYGEEERRTDTRAAAVQLLLLTHPSLEVSQGI